MAMYKNEHWIVDVFRNASYVFWGNVVILVTGYLAAYYEEMNLSLTPLIISIVAALILTYEFRFRNLSAMIANAEVMQHSPEKQSELSDIRIGMNMFWAITVSSITWYLFGAHREDGRQLTLLFPISFGLVAVILSIRYAIFFKRIRASNDMK